MCSSWRMSSRKAVFPSFLATHLHLAECERLHASLRPRIPVNSDILHAYFNSNGHALRLHGAPRAAVAVASVKIVLGTVAVETVIVMEPVVSAEMQNASVVEVKTISSRWALVEKAGRERRIAEL